MRYQCELCGKVWGDQGDASCCERRCRIGQQKNCQHEWWYRIDQRNEEIGRSCRKCQATAAMVVQINTTQTDLADMWDREAKNKEDGR